MIASIFSIDQRGGLGNHGTLPWPNHPEDMAWFRDTTMNNVVVMGRRTYDDPKFPKPLKGRTVMVVTSTPIPGVMCITGDNIVQQINDLKTRWPDKKIFIIGGSRLLDETKDLCDEAYIAHRKGGYYTDVRVDMNKYLQGMRILSSAPSTDKTINFCVYKNINLFRPL